MAAPAGRAWEMCHCDGETGLLSESGVGTSPCEVAPSHGDSTGPYEELYYIHEVLMMNLFLNSIFLVNFL